ncbi:MAG: cyclic nucleotide-binding domain-containing protein [Deltaproteobacteria bacterium]|nr:cyclic nucleotide-binding domain-containing protein [Deltaproteobacteria bacterium]
MAEPPKPISRPQPPERRSIVPASGPPAATPISQTTNRPQPPPRSSLPPNGAPPARPAAPPARPLVAPGPPGPSAPPPPAHPPVTAETTTGAPRVPTRLGAIGCHSVVGLRMADNEDATLVQPDTPLFAVADASGARWPADLVLSTLAGHASHLVEFQVKVAADASSSSRLAVGHFFESVFNEAGRAVKDEMHRRGEGRGTAAAVAVTIMGPFAYVAHIGDARAYLWRGDKLRLLTTDQTLAMLRLKRGEITPEEYTDSPFKKTLTQAIGVTPELRPDIAEVRVAPGDLILLCSDGLHRMVSDKRIAEVLAGGEDVQARAEALCREADRGGGKDNTSVVLVPVEAEAGHEVTDVELKRERLDVARILGKCFLFQTVAESDRLLIAPYFEYVPFDQGDVVCTEGEPGDSLYVVVNGKVRVTYKKAHLIDLGPGGYAGEIALAREGPRTATIVAASKTLTLKLTRARFLEILRRRPTLGVQLAVPLLENVGQRVIDVRQRLDKVQNVLAGRLDEADGP